jgi:hypothetical protein|tara:strand:- start:1054 stop:1680 length:627 start_codon:yes stop_codon:yes gene_type:complete
MNLKVIDNFLSQKHLDSLNNLKLNKINSNEVKVYHNKINNEKIFENKCINETLLIELQKTYHQVALNVLKEINPKKKDLYDYSEFQIIESGSNFVFPIHDDTPNKLLSGVIYLKPTHNSGTIFYKNKKGDDKKIIDWKINRAIFFSRSEKETWHSYEGDGKSNRIVLVYNLMTNKIKDVYKAENKNYLLGNLRFKINPYLYKYLKITI